MSHPSPSPLWWRMLITWLVIFPSVAVGQYAVAALSPSWHPVLRVGLLTAIVVPFAVGLGVPATMKALNPLRIALASRTRPTLAERAR